MLDINYRFARTRARAAGKCYMCQKGYLKNDWIAFDNDLAQPRITCIPCAEAEVAAGRGEFQPPKEKAPDESGAQPFVSQASGSINFEAIIARLAKVENENAELKAKIASLIAHFNEVDEKHVAASRELEERVVALEKPSTAVIDATPPPTSSVKTRSQLMAEHPYAKLGRDD